MSRFPRIKNTKQVLVRGFQNDLQDDGYELMTVTGPAMPTLPTAVGTLSIVSSSVSDTAGATKKVVIDYLDTNWAERRAVFLVNGTTAVILDSAAATISAIRVNRAWCNFANVGRIDIKIGSTVLAEIPIAHQTSATALYTVPVGQQAVIKGFWVTAKEAIELRVLAHLHGEVQTFRTLWTWQGEGAQYVKFDYPMRVEFETVADVWQETQITLAAVANCLTASVSAHAEIVLDLEVTRSDVDAVGFRR